MCRGCATTPRLHESGKRRGDEPATAEQLSRAVTRWQPTSCEPREASRFMFAFTWHGGCLDLGDDS